MSSQDSLLQQALTLHQSGDFVEAEKLYRLILSNEPNNHGALHLLGVLGADIYQDFGMAIQMIQKAISVEPNFNLYHQNLAIISKKAGRLDVAIEARKAELKFDPKSTEHTKTTILDRTSVFHSFSFKAKKPAASPGVADAPVVKDPEAAAKEAAARVLLWSIGGQ